MIGPGPARGLDQALGLHFMHYNLVRGHYPLRVSPAMEAGLTDHLWSMEEITRLVG